MKYISVLILITGFSFVYSPGRKQERIIGMWELKSLESSDTLKFDKLGNLIPENESHIYWGFKHSGDLVMESYFSNFIKSEINQDETLVKNDSLKFVKLSGFSAAIFQWRLERKKIFVGEDIYRIALLSKKHLVIIKE
ncbi:MAG: hypothetical protein ACK4ND_13310 [Cytophagaceae bacterium]